MPGLGVKRMPNQVRRLQEGEPEVLPPKIKMTRVRTTQRVVKPAYLPRGLSPALAANIIAALRVRLPLALKKKTMTMMKIQTNQGQGNHKEGDAAKDGRDKSASMTMALEGVETGRKKVAFALPLRQVAGGLP